MTSVEAKELHEQDVSRTQLKMSEELRTAVKETGKKEAKEFLAVIPRLKEEILKVLGESEIPLFFSEITYVLNIRGFSFMPERLKYCLKGMTLKSKIISRIPLETNKEMYSINRKNNEK